MILRINKGFTLVELLIVIVIIGVIAAMIAPTFSTGSEIVIVKTAARGVMQMSRYARTMALLHQTPVDLVFTADGSLSVVKAVADGESMVAVEAFVRTNSAEESFAEQEMAVTNEVSASESGGSGYVMADLDITKKYEGVVFLFEGYSDTIDAFEGVSVQANAREESSEEESLEEEASKFKIRYKSNGTCRPYKVQVAAQDSENQGLRIVVDFRGSAKIEEE